MRGERDFDAEGQGVTVGRPLPKLPSLSRHPEIRAVVYKNWRERKKREEGWLEAETKRKAERREEAKKTAQYKAQRSAQNRRYKAKKKREREEEKRREAALLSPPKRRCWVRLTEAEVADIERRLRKGESKRSLAKRYSVARTSIDWIEKKMTGGRK